MRHRAVGGSAIPIGPKSNSLHPPAGYIVGLMGFRTAQEETEETEKAQISVPLCYLLFLLFETKTTGAFPE